MTTPQTIGLVALVLWLLRELGWFGLELTLPHVPAVRCYCRARVKCSPFRWVPLFQWGMSSLTREGVVFRDGVDVCHVGSTTKVSMTMLGSVSALEYRKQIIKNDAESFRNWMKQYAAAGA